MPASVAEIAVGAFADSLLETVEFGDGVAVIGEGAFSFMSELKRLTAGSGVEKSATARFSIIITAATKRIRRIMQMTSDLYSAVALPYSTVRSFFLKTQR
ncbi:MAG: hypothetical protein ACLTSK_01350 [Christensenellales bacterium]